MSSWHPVIRGAAELIGSTVPGLIVTQHPL